MVFFFSIQIIGSIPLLLQSEQTELYTNHILPLSLFLCTFGSSGQFCVLYMSHLDLFPLVFATTTMGFCNIIARSVTIFSPIFAEIAYPVPAITFTVMSLTAACLATLVKEEKVKSFY